MLLMTRNKFLGFNGVAPAAPRSSKEEGSTPGSGVGEPGVKEQACKFRKIRLLVYLRI